MKPGNYNQPKIKTGDRRYLETRENHPSIYCQKARLLQIHNGERKPDEIRFLQHRLLCCTADGKNQTKTAPPRKRGKKKIEGKNESKEIRRERRAVACLRSDPTLAPRCLRHCNQPWEARLPSSFRIVAACVRASYCVSVLSVCSLKAQKGARRPRNAGQRCPFRAECA